MGESREKTTLMNLSTVRAMFLVSFERVIGQGGLLKSFVGIWDTHLTEDHWGLLETIPVETSFRIPATRIR